MVIDTKTDRQTDKVPHRGAPLLIIINNSAIGHSIHIDLGQK